MADESMANEFKAEESMAHESMADEFKPEESKIERLGKRQALYTSLYFPRGIRSRKWRSHAAICGVRDTAYFRRCASSS